jgi:hypothetical protein
MEDVTTEAPWSAAYVLIGVGVGIISIQKGIGTLLLGIALVALGAFALWGAPAVVITRTDGKKIRASTWFMDGDEADVFADAIEEVVFRAHH